MKNILSIFAIIILFGLIFHPSILANQQTSDNIENVDIEVEFFGINNHENKKINISLDEAKRLTELISFIEEKNNNISLEKNRLFYNKILLEFAEILKIEEKTLNQIQKSLQTIYYLNKILNNKNIINFKEKQNDENTNYLCYISGNATNTTVFRFSNIIPHPFWEWLNDQLYPFVRLLWFVILVMITIYPMYILSNFLIPKLLSLLPVNFMTILTLGTTWSPSSGWVYTNGLNGVFEWYTPLYGSIGSDQRLYLNLPAAYYPAIAGFSGIKINLGGVTGPFHLMYNQFFFGTALMVSIDNKN